MSFIKESIKEFDHIVWPTSLETKKYFVIVVSMITVLTIFLFIVGTAFSAALFAAKKQIVPASTVTSSSSSAPIGDLKLDNVQTTTTPVTPTESSTTKQ